MASSIIRACFLIWCTAWISIFGSSKTTSSIIQEKLASISIEDQKILSDFFRALLSQGDFAAVLLDQKPSSLHSWTWWIIKAKQGRTKNFLLLLSKGWHTWQKYSSFFPQNKYVFIDEKYHDGVFSIWFAKERFKDAIEQLSRKSLNNIEIHREIGILLGYPEEDVNGFCEEAQLQCTLQYFPYDIEAPFYPEQMYSEIGNLLTDCFEDPIERLENLNKKMHLHYLCQEDVPFFPTGIYGFRSFSDKIQDLKEWKQKIADLYNSENFLEEILALLIE